MGLFQVPVFVGFLLQYVVFRQPWEHSWYLARAKSTPELEYLRRFVTLTVLLTIGLMIYQVFPFNALLFVTIFLVGGAAFRYRVLYIDNGIVDSGGLFWSNFEIHIVIALVLVHITGCVVLSSILSGIWVTVATVPLPIWSVLFLLRIRAQRWQFLSVQNPELDELVDLEQSTSYEFPYIQPQLLFDGLNRRGSTIPAEITDTPDAQPHIPESAATHPLVDTSNAKFFTAQEIDAPSQSGSSRVSMRSRKRTTYFDI